MRGKEQMTSLLLLVIAALLAGYVFYEGFKGSAKPDDGLLAAKVADLEANLRLLDANVEKMQFLLEDVASAPKEQVFKVVGPVELELKKEKLVAAKGLALSKEELDFVKKAYAQRRAKAILKDSAKKIKELSK